MVKYQTEAVDGVFAALADPTRRAILARLATGEATMGELAEPFAMSWPAVTKHVKALERAGLLERQRQGRHHRLRLRPDSLREAAHWITDLEAFWQSSLDQLEDYLETNASTSNDEQKESEDV